MGERIKRIKWILALASWLFFAGILSGCSGRSALLPAPAHAAPPVAPTPFSQVVPSEEPIRTLALSAPIPGVSPTPTLNPEPALTTQPPPSPTVTVEATLTEDAKQVPEAYKEPINLLTGLPAADPSLLERRPIVVKVTNFPRSVRPQWGLSRADHVYEYYIGDYMSRFVAIFYGSDAERVGPVRSARLFDEHLMRLYRSIFVFGWADDPVLEFFLVPDLLPQLIVEREGGKSCPPLCRIGPSYAYNTLYLDTSQVASYLADRRSDNERQDFKGLFFAEAVPKSGNPGDRFQVKFSEVSYHRWEYDPVSERYLRFQETTDETGGVQIYAPLTDSLNAETISASNVVILLVPHEYYYQSSSTEIIDQILSGEGQGYAFRDGQLYPLTWQVEVENGSIHLILPNGQNYPLKPGNTWFEVLGESSVFSEAGSGGWAFEFRMP